MSHPNLPLQVHDLPFAHRAVPLNDAPWHHVGAFDVTARAETPAARWQRFGLVGTPESTPRSSLPRGV